MNELLFRNCKVLTMDPARPLAAAVLVRGERIVWVGPDSDVPDTSTIHRKSVDCGGGTLLPGFHDAHLHLISYAISLGAVDCGPLAVSSIEDIKRSLSRRASETAPGHWVRGVAYCDFHLREKRHPTRWDLDEAAPSHPIRLDHRTAHACVLNSVALQIAGIDASSEEPSGTTISRDLVTGEPDGLLLEFGPHLDGLIPDLRDTDLESAVLRASKSLASKGITSIQDATVTNSVSRWNTFRSLKSSGFILQRMGLMPGISHLKEFLSEGLIYRSQYDEVRLGAAKVMVTLSSGRLDPDSVELREIVLRAANYGFPVALHAVEADAISAAADAIYQARLDNSQPGATELRHRIEHGSEMPPVVLHKVVSSGANIVTQPALLYSAGTMYLEQVASDKQPYLYRIGALARAGVALAFGSDAPVVDPDPILGIYSAVTRRSLEGLLVAQDEGISMEKALQYATSGPAVAGHVECELGFVRPGMYADLVLLNHDPTSAEPEALLENGVILTVIGGKVVWQG